MNIMENAQRLNVLYHTAQGTYVRAKQELEVDGVVLSCCKDSISSILM